MRYVLIVVILSFIGCSHVYGEAQDIDSQKEKIRQRDREMLQLEKKKRNLQQDRQIMEEDMQRRKGSNQSDSVQRQIKESLRSISARINQLIDENQKAELQAFASIKIALQQSGASGDLSIIGQIGPFRWPVEGGVMTSPFGYRFDPIKKAYLLHRGIDIGAPFGTPIQAAARGRVIESRVSTGYGYIVILDHGHGFSTLYAHMFSNTVVVEVGDVVEAGQMIARVGSNGWSTGPHLHFEVAEGGNGKNPIHYFCKKVWSS